MMETNEQINSIRERVYKKPDLVINRVPENTLLKFKELCNEPDFCQDFGFGLKFLMDFYMGLIPTGIEHLEVEVESLRNELSILKQTTEQKDEQKKEETKRKMLSPEHEE